jgi:hypothetical protein
LVQSDQYHAEGETVVSRLHLIIRALILFVPFAFASAADSVEPSLEPDAVVLAKLDALGDNM